MAAEQLRPFHFPKGKTGNAGGRTKAEIALQKRVVTLIAGHTQDGAEIVDFAVKVLRGTEDGCADAKSRRWAADFLANRLWGRAPQTIEVNTGEPAQIPDMRDLTLEELRRIAAGVSNAADESESGGDPGPVH